MSAAIAMLRIAGQRAWRSIAVIWRSARASPSRLRTTPTSADIKARRSRSRGDGGKRPPGSGSSVVTRGGRRIGELGEGCILGEAAMLDGRPRTASVIVEQATRLLVVPGTAVRSLIAERPALREALLQAARARLLA